MSTSSTLAADTSALDSATRKMFRRIVPLMALAFVIAYIDRVNIGYVKHHMAADLGIGAAAYGLGAGIFFIAYALFDIPCNILQQKIGARRWLTRIMISWGLVSVGMAALQGEMSFYVMRFLLGVAEAGFVPGVYLLFSQVLPNSHRARAVAVFLMGSAFATIIAGPFSGVLLSMDGIAGLDGWQWMFVVQGGMAVVFAPLLWLLLVGKIDDARWLSGEEKAALHAELAREQGLREASDGPQASKWALLFNPNVLLLAWLYFAAVTLLYATTFWLPTIVRGFGKLSDIQVGFLTTIPWIAAMLGMWVVGKVSDRMADRRPLQMGCFLAAALGMFFSVPHIPVLQIVALSLAAIGFKGANPITVAISQRLLDVRVAATGLAIITAIGNLGGFVAPALFGQIEEVTGSITGGLYTFAAMSLVAAASVYLIPRAKLIDTPKIAEPAAKVG
jgi:MFS family permease